MEIYFELSKKQLKGLQDGTWSLKIPSSVKVYRKENSRGCFIEVEDEQIEEIINYLDGSGINWQKND
jgi:hypothetical protein